MFCSGGHLRISRLVCVGPRLEVRLGSGSLGFGLGWNSPATMGLPYTVVCDELFRFAPRPLAVLGVLE